MTPKSWTSVGCFSLHRNGDGLWPPWGLARRWRQVSHSRMATLPLIDVVQNAAKVLGGLMNVAVVMERDCRFCDGAHQARRRPLLRRLADGGHTDLGPRGLQPLDRGARRILDAWIGVVELGPVMRPCTPQGGYGQGLVQVAAEMPAPNRPGIDAHQDGAGHELLV